MTDPRDPNDLAEPLRSEVLRLMAADPRVTLTSGFRSNAQQVAARAANGCRGREYDASCKGSPTTAIPGRSRHESGQAADLADGTSGRTLIDALIRDLGLNLIRTVPGEPWHFEHASVAGRPVPAAGPQAEASGTGTLEVLTNPNTYKRVAFVWAGIVLFNLGVIAIGYDVYRSA